MIKYQNSSVGQKKSASKKGAKTTVNVIIAPQGGAGGPGAMPPRPPMMPPPGLPPGPPPGPPPVMGPGGPPPGPLPGKPPMKRGGAVKAGAGSGIGRLQKVGRGQGLK